MVLPAQLLCRGFRLICLFSSFIGGLFRETLSQKSLTRVCRGSCDEGTPGSGVLGTCSATSPREPLWAPCGGSPHPWLVPWQWGSFGGPSPEPSLGEIKWHSLVLGPPASLGPAAGSCDLGPGDVSAGHWELRQQAGAFQEEPGPPPLSCAGLLLSQGLNKENLGL